MMKQIIAINGRLSVVDSSIGVSRMVHTANMAGPTGASFVMIGTKIGVSSSTSLSVSVI